MRRLTIDPIDWTRWRVGGDVAARDRIHAAVMPWVRTMALAMASHLPPRCTVDGDDLTSVGAIAVLDAMQRFEPDRGLQLDTYAAPRIRGAMLDLLRECDEVSRLTRFREKRTNQAATDFESRHQRQPSIDELEAILGHAAVRAPETQSLCNPACETDSGRVVTHEDLLTSPNISPADVVSTADTLRRLFGPNQRERLMLQLIYEDGLSMKETGRALGLTESRISQMHKRAIADLRERLTPCAA